LYATCRFSLRKASCGTGTQTFLLDATGDLYPCLNTNVPALRAGDIREPGFDFTRFWNDSPVLRAVRHETSVDGEAGACRDCVVKYWCLGGCRGETLQTQGALGERAWNCGEQRRAVLDMFWRLAGRPDWVRVVAGGDAC
jgi:radical SAM protein with 4Fe4S-binding SPASM domain